MITHQPKDGHPPEGSILQTLNLAHHPRGGGGVKTIMDFFYNEKCNQDKNSQNRWKMMEFDTEELILVKIVNTREKKRKKIRL